MSQFYVIKDMAGKIYGINTYDASGLSNLQTSLTNLVNTDLATAQEKYQDAHYTVAINQTDASHAGVQVTKSISETNMGITNSYDVKFMHSCYGIDIFINP